MADQASGDGRPGSAEGRLGVRPAWPAALAGRVGPALRRARVGLEAALTVTGGALVTGGAAAAAGARRCGEAIATGARRATSWLARASGHAWRAGDAALRSTRAALALAGARLAVASAGPRRAARRLGARAMVVIADALYHIGVGVLRVFAIIGLIVLLAAMGTAVALPAVVPGAKAVKAGIDRFSRFPPLPEELAKPPVITTIQASDGSVLSWLYDGEIRKTVKLSEVPMLVRQAVLAIEDSRFYEHNGVDYRGIVRAAKANFERGQITQGGSTLTQQYIKLVTNQKETTLDRKVQEAQYALELERRLSKDQIFENYLNIAYFGDGVYGIATAAEHFFSKPLADLTLVEAASLAGTIADPNDYNPLNPEENQRRRNQVLDRMAELGYASPAEVAQAKAAKLEVKIKKEPNRYPYYHTYISAQLQNDKRFDKVLGPVGSKERKRMVFGGGLTVKTTLVPKHQRYAQSAVTTQLRSALDSPSRRLQGALASVDPSDGAILTIVGGRKFDAERTKGTSTVNFAVDGRGGDGYPPGSAFKLFFMLAALERGYSPLTTFAAPSRLHLYRKECPPEAGGWEVGNAEGGASGPIDMYTATANSVNTWYAQLSHAIGPSAGVEMARRLGIKIPPKDSKRYRGNWNVCSAVLGPNNVTVLDMASAYGTLANDGVRCEPYSISEIIGPDGKVLYKHKPKCKRVLSQRVARTAVDILKGGPAHGTGTAANFGRPLAGKTGTASDYKSAFFAGFTPQIAAAVWVGYPTPRPMVKEYQGRRVYGGTFPALIFRHYMEAAHQGLKVRDFPSPPAAAGSRLPDVVGMRLGEAIGRLRGAGYSVRFEPGNAGDGAVVVEMVPRAGSRVGKGSVIHLRVGSPRDEEREERPGRGRGGGGDT